MQKIFDSHFHIIDPKFKLIENNGFVPEYYTVDDYNKELAELGLVAASGRLFQVLFKAMSRVTLMMR